MGLTWSNPIPISDATKIMIKAAFPKSKTLNSEIWNLWHYYKNSLKNDGFAIYRNKNIYYIHYFCEITDKSFIKQNTSDGMIPTYLAEFKRKYSEWKDIMHELNTVENIKNLSDQDQDSWYYHMENDNDTDMYE